MKLYHVIKDWVHPRNRWTRRPDGLYDLSGSVYAFRDSDVRECTAQSWAEPCRCVPPEPEHTCGPGINYGCEHPECDGDVGD